ncbi:crotonase/enoyl-CoA hydratase family protein [Salinirussus salinus]|jgi:enoyl-CoA hydratase|uniref:crotonase/enoyl-CoA hydratase family protein n=1 Tax=Salinirussus salinus TaxID=1198300 RepID=UPI0013586C7B|nr:crotonase/enoyl-CoA hydratase family protein [Salinirussus salinus]
MSGTVSYETSGRKATITLDRPKRYNAIDDDMPGELRAAVERADEDEDIHVTVLTGAGEAFCSGYDLKHYAEDPRPTMGSQEMPWDPMQDYRMMKSNTEDFMSLWRSYTPVICKVNGPAVAGGSDIALCADLIIMDEDARIGYPPARVWGCPTTMMWVYRLGPAGAKRMLFTGDLVEGDEAADMGLVWEAVPGDELDDRVDELAHRIAGIPQNQLMMQKLAINQAYENMGRETTQMFATIFDGMTRHTPEGVAFKERCEEVGFQQAVAERDQGELFE